jgi:hypothetical protein
LGLKSFPNIARSFAGMRLAELGEAGGGIAYPAVCVAIKRLEKRPQVDREEIDRSREIDEHLDVTSFWPTFNRR